MAVCVAVIVFVVVGLELIVAGIGKLVWRPNPEQFAPWLPAYARPAGHLVPWIEAGTGILLLSLSPPVAAVAVAAGLYTAFTAHHLWLARLRSDSPCGCGVFAGATHTEAAVVTGVKAAALACTLVVGIPSFSPSTIVALTSFVSAGTIILWLRGRFVAKRIRARIQHV
ncbi:MAG TPA: MauE/DoxX family redox-associated membrane protein [Steroidobacter sp.]